MSTTATRYVRVGHASDVPEGRAEVFEVEDRYIAVFRVPDAAWPAWAVACPSGPGRGPQLIAGAPYR